MFTHQKSRNRLQTSFSLFYFHRSLSYTYSTICSRQILWHIHFRCTFCSRWYWLCEATVKWPFESITWVDTAGGLTSVGKNKVATAKHMHCQVIYSTRGGSQIQLHRLILEGAVLCSTETPLLFLSWNTLQQWLPWSWQATGYTGFRFHPVVIEFKELPLHVWSFTLFGFRGDITSISMFFFGHQTHF